MLRAGGNAVDAAVACVLMSFVAESPLTGPGAGGFMLVHTAGRRGPPARLLRGGARAAGSTSREPAELTPIDVHFSEDAVQRFNVGPSSCGAYGTTLGLAEALERFGTASPRPTSRAGARARGARGRRGRADAGLPVRGPRADPPLHARSATAIYAPGGRLLREGDTIRLPELGDLLERLGAEGPGFLYTGDVAARGAATGCSSAAGCSRARTSPPTRWSSASRRAWPTAAARCSPTRRPPRAAS